MTLLNAGKNRVRDILSTDITTGECGTGTTAVALSDTDIETSASGSQNDVSVSTADKQVTVDYVLTSVEGNGAAVTELGLWTNSDATLLSHFVFTSLVKSSTEEWQFSIIYKIV